MNTDIKYENCISIASQDIVDKRFLQSRPKVNVSQYATIFEIVRKVLSQAMYSPTGNSWQLRHNLFTYIFDHMLFLLKEDCDFLTTMKCSWSP